MLLNPAVIALIAASFLGSVFTLYACGVGLRVLFYWNLDSAEEKQLQLERKTYLISSILSHVMVIELGSLFLFIAVVNQLHTFFTGAMCAAGVLNVNHFGHLTLAARTTSFLCCGVWLVINHVDTLAWDYPLIRYKYSFLLGIGLLLVTETVLQARFLGGLDPQILTSCCGTIFGEESRSVASGIAHMPAPAAATNFYLGMVLTLAAGAWFIRTLRHDWLYGLLSLAVFPLSLAALISFFCLYIYELPTHHCPFCLLQGEYNYLGYFLYGSLLVGAISGCSIAVIGRFRRRVSLAGLIPRIQRRLCWVSMLGYGLFTARVTCQIVFSDLKLFNG